jgi:deoxycytidine triphosphate deaminase
MPKFWDDWKRKAGLALLKDEVLELRRAKEIECLESLPEIPFDPGRPTGVLLSDEIEHYATKYGMINPFSLEKLKAARYELSVGDLYSRGGKTVPLSDEAGQNEIVINPFEVAIVQTFERLNLPHFIIARWNIRVRWAYQGLLWVGAAQVDAGYKGYLDCPLYNLSNKPVTLYKGQEIAVIDFVTTTPPSKRSDTFKYRPINRARILFEDYEPDKLESALAKLAKEKIEVFEDRINEIQNTVSNSVGVILTAIGVLVAALALFVSRQTDAISNFSPSLIVAGIALIVSFLALVSVKKSPRISRSWFGMQVISWLLLGALIVWLSVYTISINRHTSLSTPLPTTTKQSTDLQHGSAH